MKIAGVEIPNWALAVGGGGVLLIMLISDKKTDVEETNTGTGMLAAEFDQRLSEQWQAWQDWANQFMNDPQGPVAPIDGGLSSSMAITDRPGYTVVHGVETPIGESISGYSANYNFDNSTGSVPSGWMTTALPAGVSGLSGGLSNSDVPGYTVVHGVETPINVGISG